LCFGAVVTAAQEVPTEVRPVLVAALLGLAAHLALAALLARA